MMSLRMMLWTAIGLLIHQKNLIIPLRNGYCFTRLNSEGKAIISIFVEEIKGQSIDLNITSQFSSFSIYPDVMRYSRKNITTNKRFLILFDTKEEGAFHICFKIIPEYNHIPRSPICDIKYIEDPKEVDNIIQSIIDAGINEG